MEKNGQQEIASRQNAECGFDNKQVVRSYEAFLRVAASQ